MNYLETVGPSLLGSSPILVAWLVGVVLAVRMVRRGGKAEHLLLIGCSLMFVAQIVRPFLTALALWLVHEHEMTRVSSIGLIFSLPTSIMNMAGIICLMFAFWIRWKTKAITQ